MNIAGVLSHRLPHVWFQPQPRPGLPWADGVSPLMGAPHISTSAHDLLPNHLPCKCSPEVGRCFSLGTTLNQWALPWVSVVAYPPSGEWFWEAFCKILRGLWIIITYIGSSFFPVSLPLSPSLFSVSWDHLPSKWLAFKPLPLALILREPKLKYNLFNCGG